MEYHTVHRHSLGSVLQSREASMLQESNSNLSYLQAFVAWKYLSAERRMVVGYSWNFFAVVSFVSLPALQGLHQPRKKVNSLYWKVISIMLKYFQVKATLSSNVDSCLLCQTDLLPIQSSKKKPQKTKNCNSYFSNEGRITRLLLTTPLLHQALCL